MAGMLTNVATGVGGLTAVVAVVGVGLSLGAGQAPESVSTGLLVAGLVALGMGFVSTFEHQSRLWADPMDEQLQARRSTGNC